MTRVFEFDEPNADYKPIVVRMTEGEILAAYWDQWSQEMRRLGFPGINPDRCIDDFVVCNWAIEVEIK